MAAGLTRLTFLGSVVAVLLLLAPDAWANNEIFSVTRVVSDERGVSRFEDASVNFEMKDFAPPSGPIGVSLFEPARSIVFTRAMPDWSGDWHPTPREQYVLVLMGLLEVEVGSGEVRRFKPGSVLRLEDTSGRGHESRVVGDSPAVFGMIAVSEIE